MTECIVMNDGNELYAVPKEKLRQFHSLTGDAFEREFEPFRMQKGDIVFVNMPTRVFWPELFLQWTDYRSEGFDYRGIDTDGRAFYYKTEPVFKEDIGAWDIPEETEVFPEDWAKFVGTIDPIEAQRIAKYSLQKRP